MPTINPISQYYARLGRWPANNQIWWLARSDIDDSTRNLKIGDFMPELLDKMFMGSMRVPRGHYVLHAFNKDRSAVSGVLDIPVESITERPPTVSFFSGRVWFACKSTVYFSQILTDKSKAGLCYMEADPTSEHLSDPLDTDGGVVQIPEANKIIRLTPHAGGMLVFALNGVWFITGTSQGFTALDISVNKVSPIGCRAPFSVVETDTAVFWWSDQGIMGATQDKGVYGPIQGSFTSTNISEETIQAFYNDIPNSVRAEAKGLFDPKANVAYWLYRDGDSVTTRYNRVLALDLTLKAFYPWKFSDISGGPKIKGFYLSDKQNTYTIDTDIRPSNIEYVLSKGTEFRVGQVRSGNFADWYTHNEVGISYDSYVEAGYELFDDAMRKKAITYIFAYLTRTEDSEGNGPSSCKMRIKWDWASGTQSNKWTPEVEVYRPGRLLLDTGDTGFGMVVTKNKVRGNGKAIQFRFGCSEAGKNFDLNGWSVAVTGNVTP